MRKKRPSVDWDIIITEAQTGNREAKRFLMWDEEKGRKE